MRTVAGSTASLSRGTSRCWRDSGRLRHLPVASCPGRARGRPLPRVRVVPRPGMRAAQPASACPATPWPPWLRARPPADRVPHLTDRTPSRNAGPARRAPGSWQRTRLVRRCPLHSVPWNTRTASRRRPADAWRTRAGMPAVESTRRRGKANWWQADSPPCTRLPRSFSPNLEASGSSTAGQASPGLVSHSTSCPPRATERQTGSSSGAPISTAASLRSENSVPGRAPGAGSALTNGKRSTLSSIGWRHSVRCRWRWTASFSGICLATSIDVAHIRDGTTGCPLENALHPVSVRARRTGRHSL
jgi:hypothetical protein